MTDDKDNQSGPSAGNGGNVDAAKHGQDSTVLATIDPQQDPTSNAKPQQSQAEVNDAGGLGFIKRLPWLASLSLLLVVMVGFLTLQNSQQTGRLESMQQKAAQLDQQLLLDQQKFQQQLATMQSSLNQNKAQFESLQSEILSAQRDRLDLEEKIKQVSLQASAKGRDPLKWRLAEVEYLLALANHRLILSQDHNTALTALIDADKRLRTIADPGLGQIRLEIAKEIKSLQSVQVPDIAGMAMKLSALVEGIGQLPLVNRERMLRKEASGLGQEVESWDQIPAAIWRDIKGLITVRRSDVAIEPILPPDELHYLSQNLGLKIEQARLALLRKDTELFRSNLKDTGLWVSRYFDHDTTAVTQVIESINSLMASEVVASMPDISGSLRQLRRWRAAQETLSFSRPLSKSLTKPAQQSSVEKGSVEKSTVSAVKKSVPEPVVQIRPLQEKALPSNAETIKPESDQGLSSASAAEQAAADQAATIDSEAEVSAATQSPNEVMTITTPSEATTP